MINVDEYSNKELIRALQTCWAKDKKCSKCPYRHFSPYCVETMLGDALERIWYLEATEQSLKGYREIIVKHIHKHDYEEDE